MGCLSGLCATCRMWWDLEREPNLASSSESSRLTQGAYRGTDGWREALHEICRAAEGKSTINSSDVYEVTSMIIDYLKIRLEPLDNL
jgi:hypothetical protein